MEISRKKKISKFTASGKHDLEGAKTVNIMMPTSVEASMVCFTESRNLKK